jgi:UDP-glucuronate 4-epimerase
MFMQKGDVYKTYADTEDLFNATGFRSNVSVEEGVESFVNWYKDYYSLA